jgi:hypothetical protein
LVLHTIASSYCFNLLSVLDLPRQAAKTVGSILIASL